jgi:hypothetical protein
MVAAIAADQVGMAWGVHHTHYAISGDRADRLLERRGSAGGRNGVWLVAWPSPNPRMPHRHS